MQSMNHGAVKKHVVILVHGIRTFGAWQERLRALLHQREPEVEVHVFKYGYFSLLAFLIPFLRTMVIRRFRRYLAGNASAWQDARVDIVAHSFGTYVTAWALRDLQPEQRPKVHTILFCGSVLKQLFPWETMIGKELSVARVINDCGTKDIWPVVAQLFVLGMGISGRRGFAGVTGTDVGIINRYFEGSGHSDFFKDAFMNKNWIPLLTGSAPPAPTQLIPPTPRWGAALEYYADPIKIVLLLSPFILGFFIWQAERFKTEEARADTAEAEVRVAMERENAAEARFNAAEAKTEKIKALAKAEQDSLAKLAAIEKQKQAEEHQKQEEALRLVAEANRLLYLDPQQAFLYATQARGTSPVPPAQFTQEAALKVIMQRRAVEQLEESDHYDPGNSWYVPASFNGTFTALTTRDGKYVLFNPERGNDSDSFENVYVLNNETQKLVKLEPTERPVQKNHTLTYYGFSSSNNSIYLARGTYNHYIEVYSIDGVFEKSVRLQCCKESVSLVNSVQDDGLIVAGDWEGNVWSIPVTTERQEDLARQWGKKDPLIYFELSPSGKRALMIHREFVPKRDSLNAQETHYDKYKRAYVWWVGKKSRKEIAHGASVNYATFKRTDEEEVFVTAGSDGTVALWNVGKKKIQPVKRFQHGGRPVGYATFSRDGGRILTVPDGQAPRVWDIRTGQQVLQNAEALWRSVNGPLVDVQKPPIVKNE